MMKSEFIERTGYEPDDYEYRLIEESYYAFPGDKNAFCKQWLQDKRDGHWAREMQLLKEQAKLAEQLAEHMKDLKKLQADRDGLVTKLIEAKHSAQEKDEKLARLERVFRRVFEEEKENG